MGQQEDTRLFDDRGFCEDSLYKMKIRYPEGLDVLDPKLKGNESRWKALSMNSIQLVLSIC